MNYSEDKRIVLTLDAGGTNFVFSAVQGNSEIIQPITLPANPNDLELCLQTVVDGFTQVKSQLNDKPVAISFAFPGPADYPRGIIGDLPNLPAFRGGVALGPMLEDVFQLPVFINNDGDLFAYGEAMTGYLPYINNLLRKTGSPKQYNNLLGVTLGTGFGGGVVRNGELFIGDNAIAAEIWLLRNKLIPSTNADEGVSIRAVRRAYAELSGISFDEAPEPKDIYEIGQGVKQGNKKAAVESFAKMAEIMGDALANAITIIDGIIVIGGGISHAHSLFLDLVIKEMNSTYTNIQGVSFPRLASKAFNLENETELDIFLKGESRKISVPKSSREIVYDPLARVGVGVSKLGASKAIALGAYAYALNKI